MSNPESQSTPNFLEMLRQLLAGKEQTIPAWLEDLLVLGPRLELWTPPETRPNRVLITEFLARWLKQAGLSQEECLGWLDPYCYLVLKQYSKSGMSAVRHGTKANTRWVYSSNFHFDFEAIAREVAPKTAPGQPPYLPIVERWYELLWEAKDTARKNYVPPVIVPLIPVKKRHREQFLKAVEIAKQMRAEGAKPGKIIEHLHSQGFVTKTGRKWTHAALNQAIRDTTPFPGIPDPIASRQ